MPTSAMSGQSLGKHQALQQPLRLRLGCGEGLSSWLDPQPSAKELGWEPSRRSPGECESSQNDTIKERCEAVT